MNLINLLVLLTAWSNKDIVSIVVSGGAIALGAVLVLQAGGIYSKVAQNRNPSRGQLTLVVIVGLLGVAFFGVAIVAEYMKSIEQRSAGPASLQIVANSWPDDFLGDLPLSVAPPVGQDGYVINSSRSASIDLTKPFHNFELKFANAKKLIDQRQEKQKSDITALQKIIDQFNKSAKPIEGKNVGVGKPPEI
jgi:hypothetical protein